MATIVEVYIKMMLEDGVFHADPHPGNLLVDASGRLVLLDFGMVLRVERAVQARLVRTILAAVRRDTDGVINGLYELGILDPDVDRATVRDAARQLMSISLRDDLSSRQIQHVVEQVLRTFYDWPLMLPADFVYFGRAAVLVEGIGFRYDPDFNAVATARPVVERAAGRLLTGLGDREGEGGARLLELEIEAAGAVRTLRDLLQRVSGRNSGCAGTRATRSTPAVPGAAGAARAARPVRAHHRAGGERPLSGDPPPGDPAPRPRHLVRDVSRDLRAAEPPVPEPAPFPRGWPRG